MLNFVEEFFKLICTINNSMPKKSKFDKEYEEAVKYWNWVFSLPKAKQDEIIYEMLEKSSRAAYGNER